jgi:hypothetical protein
MLEVCKAHKKVLALVKEMGIRQRKQKKIMEMKEFKESEEDQLV